MSKLEKFLMIAQPVTALLAITISIAAMMK